PEGYALAGNVFTAYGDRLPAGAQRTPALPTAAAMLRLAPALLAAGHAVAAAQALPLYVRDKVAQTTEERTALRLAREAASQGSPS
ncbi:MAG TPA: tRNA (adenosine(37)-N6)-threonylcarbamoyltransferase complex dimerization subunit type 1 TsaB, partial [Ramlibacter sp.]|nr:tRNA (adenosine(37)-N6)-threonylcarbamoyltransferase complex dimerization subunit type 1 TsaB [Ramlibacter sp.]